MIVQETGGSFKPIPEGSYTATCIRVIDLGTQLINFQGVESAKRQVLIAWEIPEVEVEFDGQTHPALIMKTYTASLSDKANLRKHLEAWRGKKFTGDELKGFDLANLLGKSCMIQVLHSESNGTVYSNIAAIMALPRGSVSPVPYHPLIHLDLSVAGFSQDAFDKLSPKMREKISHTAEYKLATGQLVHEDTSGGYNKSSYADDLDDEIPF